MSEATVLDYLREQFARLNGKMDAMQGDITNFKVRMTGVEAETGNLRIGLAEVNNRLDRMDARMERLERRFELVG